MLRILAATLLLAGPAAAETIGSLEVSIPMLRATPPNAPVAAGYLVITNLGETDDTLVAATIDNAAVGRVELHEMTLQDGIMSMSEVDGGVPIPAGEVVALQPGGLHLMLMGLSAPLAEGESHEVTLTFAEAGEIALSFPVKGLGEIREVFDAADIPAGGEHGAHGHGADGHGDAHSGHDHGSHGDKDDAHANH